MSRAPPVQGCPVSGPRGILQLHELAFTWLVSCRALVPTPLTQTRHWGDPPAQHQGCTLESTAQLPPKSFGIRPMLFDFGWTVRQIKGNERSIAFCRRTNVVALLLPSTSVVWRHTFVIPLPRTSMSVVPSSVIDQLLTFPVCVTRMPVPQGRLVES